MTSRVGINGSGRTGRAFLRALRGDPDGLSTGLGVFAVNDPADAETLAHVLRYDSGLAGAGR